MPPMPEVLTDLFHLPLGSHCVSFHASRDEAADHAVRFIAGSPKDQSAVYWVPTPGLATYYNERLADVAPDHVGCVRVLAEEQVEPVEDGKLRPVETVRDFIHDHPEGVTGAGETLSVHWVPENIPEHLEYEAWFESQPRDGSRFLCPYDLRRVPPTMAPGILRELGKHHSHAVLSSSTEPAVRLLQLFVFASPREIPPQLDDTLRWAAEHHLVDVRGPDDELVLTREGEEIVEGWSKVTTIDW